jgi:HemY protein
MRASGDPAWTADGVVSDRWMPVSPSGRLDAFQWKVPLAEIGVAHPVIEAIERPMARPHAIDLPRAVPEPLAETPPRRAPKPKAAVKPKPVEAVIPLVHAPDDPGPESVLEPDPVPETTSPPPVTAAQAWQRLRQLFRELRS